MNNKLNKNWLAAGLFAAGLSILMASWLAGLADQSGPMLSTGTVAALVAFLGFLAFAGRLDWVAAGEMAVGAWSLVAPVVLGFTSDPAFWIHFFAGLLVMAVGIVGSDLSDRRPPHSFT